MVLHLSLKGFNYSLLISASVLWNRTSFSIASIRFLRLRAAVRFMTSGSRRSRSKSASNYSLASVDTRLMIAWKSLFSYLEIYQKWGIVLLLGHLRLRVTDLIVQRVKLFLLFLNLFLKGNDFAILLLHEGLTILQILQYYAHANWGLLSLHHWRWQTWSLTGF